VNDAPRYSSLHDYLRVLREQRLVIALIALVATAVALFISLRQEPVYEATSAIAFQDEQQEISLLGGTPNPNTPVEQRPQGRAATIDEPQVMRRLARRLDGDVSVPQLESAIGTAVNEESFLVDVTANWASSEFAAKLANDFAREATSFTNTEARSRYEAAVDEVEARLDRLGREIDDQLERAALTQQLIRLRFLADNAEPAQVAETAQPPGAPTSPKTARNTALGAMLGLVIGIVVAFLRDALDRRLRGSRDVHDELGYPILGFVRDDAMGRRLRQSNGYSEKLSDDLEGFRIIRQNLEFLAAGETSRKRVVVSSPLPSEGKTTVASSLALASVVAGKRTLLVECDLRRPALAERLALRPSPGLTDYLVGRAEPASILQALPRVMSGNGTGPNGAATATRDSSPVIGQSLVCITAGTPSPVPAELIGSERFRSFLDEVSAAYDLVVLDTSPILPVADTLELLPHVDAVLLCVRSNQTTRDQARAARATLEHFPDRPTGLVVTGLRKRDAPEYSYYSYGYGYRTAPRETSAA
jgi:Mrp family chromosome partitioning ATPase/capsular polysaccharide biosynthesis protein